MLNGLKERARLLKRETLTLYFAVGDPRTPWYAKLVAAGVVAYALSPIDLIPDFIPIVGYLDDLIVVPAGIALVLRLVPSDVLADCRVLARRQVERPTSRVGAIVVVAIWAIFVVWVAQFVRDLVM